MYVCAYASPGAAVGSHLLYPRRFVFATITSSEWEGQPDQRAGDEAGTPVAWGRMLCKVAEWAREDDAVEWVE